MKKMLALLFLSSPLFAEEALGVPVPAGLQIYQTNIDGVAVGQFVMSTAGDIKPAFYFLVLWGKFLEDKEQEGMPRKFGGTQLIFNSQAKNFDKVEFIITGKGSTNIVFRKLELSNGAYKKSENEFDVLELINILGEDTNSYSNISLEFYRGKKLVDRQALTAQEITQLKKIILFGRAVLSAMMKEWMTAASQMIKKSMPQVGESVDKSTLKNSK